MSHQLLWCLPTTDCDLSQVTSQCALTKRDPVHSGLWGISLSSSSRTFIFLSRPDLSNQCNRNKIELKTLNHCLDLIWTTNHLIFQRVMLTDIKTLPIKWLIYIYMWAYLIIGLQYQIWNILHTKFIWIRKIIRNKKCYK